MIYYTCVYIYIYMNMVCIDKVYIIRNPHDKASLYITCYTNILIIYVMSCHNIYNLNIIYITYIYKWCIVCISMNI